VNNPGIIKAFTAETAIEPYRIVKFGSEDDEVVQEAAVSDGSIGVADKLGGTAGGRVEVSLSGATEVEYGGTITRGALITSDADGKAVASAPAAGVNNRTVGVAMVSGVAGDIGSVLINPGQTQG